MLWLVLASVRMAVLLARVSLLTTTSIPSCGKTSAASALKTKVAVLAAAGGRAISADSQAPMPIVTR
jgi:hypothetical protein